ncbi:uncharacterized protein LOC110919914 [Helianthus annuus]|uniref:uncharacterized protein LOC110919914 n=1 Tax=Helianthus annuus TaxID=4232 RepID=UPI000B8F0857|nr:uncharacterized protein LOC110919914 [Helianthus annuus]
MAETPSNRPSGPRSENFAHDLRVEGIVEEAPDDNDVQHNVNHLNDPVTPGAQPEIPISSILPPGETPISWYVRSQGALNAVYAQAAQPATQSRRSTSRAKRSPRRTVLLQTSVSPFRLGPRSYQKWDTQTDEYDRTYEEGDNTSVFSRLQRDHANYKPKVHEVYNPDAEYDYNLIYRPAEAAENSKFVSEIALAPLERAKLPSNVGKFNGLSDPDDHLRVFTSAGLVGGWTLPMWCHLFVQTLTGATRLWFDNLPVGKLTSWVDLGRSFWSISVNSADPLETADVMNIWRRDDESLEDFITRYNKEVLEIGDIHEHLIRAQFKYAVRCDDMIKVLSGTEGLPKSWEKLIVVAKIYAQTERNLSSNRPPLPHNHQQDMSGNSGRKFKKIWKDLASGAYLSDDARATINKLAAKKEDKQENRERQWTPLTKTPAEVLSTEYYQFKTPPPMKNKRGQDPNLYCEYHKDNGHTTNNCISLRTEIEKALKSGELTHLVQNVRKDIKQITRGDEGPSSKKAKET